MPFLCSCGSNGDHSKGLNCRKEKGQTRDVPVKLQAAGTV